MLRRNECRPPPPGMPGWWGLQEPPTWAWGISAAGRHARNCAEAGTEGTGGSFSRQRGPSRSIKILVILKRKGVSSLNHAICILCYRRSYQELRCTWTNAAHLSAPLEKTHNLELFAVHINCLWEEFCKKLCNFRSFLYQKKKIDISN